MAQSFVPIQRITLTGTSSQVDFTNIPQNYTDLKLLISSRNNDASSWGNILVGFNDSTTGYTNRYLQGNGSSIGTGIVAQMVGDMNTTTSTANTFNNIEVYISNYTSSNNKAWYADSIATTNSTTGFQLLNANLWANSAAINKISITNRNGGVSFVAGCTFTLYGIGGDRATGGTLTSDNIFRYHTFTSSGTFTALENIDGVQALIVAGGGGGGSRSGGGGGAGGLVVVTPIKVNAGINYSVIVGSGGTGGARNLDSTNGGNSSFGSFVAIGGGGGASAVAQTNAGRAGGSGGGGANNFTGGAATQGSGTNFTGYGNAGGNSNNNTFDGCGGGGAGDRVNTDALTSGGGGAGAGNGGIGLRLMDWSTATNTGEREGWYAGGGGGGSFGASANHGKGGLGGGGRGHDTTPTNGTANTGGGAGGCGNSANTNTTPVGANGGSGIVIIRYPHSAY